MLCAMAVDAVVLMATNCNAQCVDIANGRDNRGACSVSCPGNIACRTGRCSSPTIANGDGRGSRRGRLNCDRGRVSENFFSSASVQDGVYRE